MKIFQYLSIFFITMTSCGDKLDLKPDSYLTVPKSISDLESLLDNSDVINATPGLSQLSADEYHIPTLANFNALTRPMLRSTYIWDEDIYQGMTKVPDWTVPYQQVFYANSVLDELKKMDKSSDIKAQEVMGWALFVRAYAFYSLASIYAKAFDPVSSYTDLGIPLKLNAAITEIVPRSTVQETYNQIITDALEASKILPTNIITDKRNRPSKTAAYAFLARVYLSMRNYVEAEKYADLTLELHNTLTNYNSLPIRTSSSFTYNSDEVIYFSNMRITTYSSLTYASGTLYGILPNIVNTFQPNDLRKAVWFRSNANGNTYIKGINSASALPFTGLATDELLYIKAECLARRSETQAAMDNINKLLLTRWNPNATTPTKPYQNITAINPMDALDKVLQERKKGLLWRSTRWTDLKRLNLEGRNIVLERNIEGKTYTLEPNSTKYVLPIPNDEIALSNIQQNIRK